MRGGGGGFMYLFSFKTYLKILKLSLVSDEVTL